MSLKDSRSAQQQGMALILALISLVVIAGIAMLMFTRSLNEIQHSSDDARIVQTLMLARGGANVGSALMASDVKTELYDIVLATSTPGRWSYGRDPSSGVESSTPDPVSVAEDLVNVANRLQSAVDPMVCGIDALGGVQGSTVGVRVYFTNSACNKTQALPGEVALPGGRYVSGPPRIEEDMGVQEYALPFVMVSEASLGDYRRNIVVQGEYVFSVGEAPFSHYAYFTNRESIGNPSSTGNRIYFTNSTLIDGPTHTNGNFSMHLTPWFGGSVTSAGCRWSDNLTTYRNNCVDSPTTRNRGVYFNGRNDLVGPGSLNNPSPNRPQFITGSGSNRRVHQPEFTAGVAWDAQFVPLPTNSHSQANVAIGDTRDDRGIYFDGDWDSVEVFAGDGNGNRPTLQGGVWTPRTTYQYVTATRELGYYRTYSCGRFSTCTEWVSTGTEIIRHRFNQDQILQTWNQSTNSWVTEAKPFNGVIYVNGDVDRLTGPKRSSGNLTSQNGAATVPPSVAHFAQMTIAGAGDIRITSDLKYEDPPCSAPPQKVNGVGQSATCTNLAARNVLGIFTAGGNVNIGNGHSDSSLNAPHHVHIHSVLMSGSSQVRVENHTTPDRGNVYLLGGLIQENRGIFGLVGGAGYDRVFTYDPRMRLGMAPPFFPTTGLGSVQDVRYFSFGQREQLY